MLNVLDIFIQYGDRILLNNISFSAKPNEKIGLAGRNGAGKSTILKVIAGDITPDKGKISYPNGYTIGYLHQDIKIKEDKTVMEEALTAFDQLNAIEERLEEINVDLETRTDYESDSYTRILEEMATLNDHLAHMGDMSQAEAKTERILQGLGFKHSEMSKPIAELSGGWKMRIELAKILLSEVDLLLLDEPTNHLDIESIVWFEEYLKSYTGTLILISHDVRLLDNVTTRTIEVELGKIYDYKANYSQYLIQRKERRALLQSQFDNQQKTIKEKKLTTVEEISEHTKAGSGCGQCLPEIETLLQRVLDQEKKREEKPPMTQLQKIRLIEEVIDQQVRPILRRDGGDLELHDVDGNRVFVKFQGACISCPVSSVTLKDVVETQLREAVSEDIVVEAV